MFNWAITAITLVILLANAANAQVARVELLPIVSRTLSDTDFLSGRIGGGEVTIAGELRIPKPGTDKLPAVILLHGSGGMGGIGGSIDEWEKELNQLGIATFSIDSFSGRGILNTLSDQSQLGRLNMIMDAYRSLAVLAKHPRIDAARIAVMGFSRGGQSALYSAMTRLHDAAQAGNLRFVAHVAFYPDCVTTYRKDTDVTGSPIRIFHGTSDDYNPIAPCRSYVERLKAENKDVQLYEYSDTYHVFDSPAFQKPLKLSAATTTRNCQLVEMDDSRIMNQATQKLFAYSDECVEKGPTIAFNEAANSQARGSVREFLLAVFRLK